MMARSKTLLVPSIMPAIEILYQDNDLLVVNKPSGLLTVPGRGPDKQDCLINRLLSDFPNARIVHRLDMVTSGLVIIPLCHPSQVHIGRQFELRTMKKKYVAIVNGKLDSNSGEVDLPLICDWPNRPLQIVDHENGKSALTRYEVINYCEQTDSSRIHLEPQTGRTHQLRVHMQALGHPILGDPFYAPPAIQAKAPRLCLHAQSLSFKHPSHEELISIDCPPDF